MQKKVWIGLLVLGLLVSLFWGYNKNREASELSLVTENQNRRSLQNLSGHLKKLETVMAKEAVVSTNSQKILYLSQVWSQSEDAVRDLAQLPAEQFGLNYLGQFLTQTADYAQVLAQRLASGGVIDPAEQKQFNDIHERLLPVSNNVQQLLQRVDNEGLAWTEKSNGKKVQAGGLQLAEAAAEGQEGPPGSVGKGLEQLNASLQKLPPFSYTGEFSTREVPEPLGLPQGEISREQALANAKDFLSKVGFPNAVPELASETSGPMGGYLWKSDNVFLEVCRRGGVVISYRDQRTPESRLLNIDNVKEKAMAALKNLGWQLTLTSTEDFGSYLQMEAVSEKAGIRYYPDKVRFTVAMDNGQLTGFDSSAYYAFHHERTLPQKILTMKQAAAKLRPDFEIIDSRQAVISKVGNQEVLCYEFRGRSQGEDYLVYINCQSGLEENVLRIIQTPRGEYIE
ncbi:MAG TPA: PepSY1/2 domain-containing protein [Desulfitobacteriaceae bacterium]|jgi:spore germination protein|nr:PepSY1/2 domain-containing protein [Desulfitobacteriaceae bacterium]